MALRPKSEMSPPPPPPAPSSGKRNAVIEELQRGTQLAVLLRQQVEQIPEVDRRHAALGNVSDISMALLSSLSVLQSEREHCSSSDAGAMAYAAPAAYASDEGVGSRNGGAASRTRTRKAKHRRARHGEELPNKEILTQTPENDRFHWRKYGEKKILNADFPRLYYRCGYSDEHKCPAKKYVQQQNNSDPPLFMVTLINEHTCDTLFPHQPPSSSCSANPYVLDFAKASISSPMVAPAVGAPKLKKEEEMSMSATMPSYMYDELSSSLPLLSPKQYWELETEMGGPFHQESGSSSFSN